MGEIKKHNISKSDEQAWMEYRKNYVNASEVGVVMGLSKYQVAADLLLKKSGWKDDNRDGNKHTFYGDLLEDAVAETWQYYDFSDPEAYIMNYKHGKKIRNCRRVDGSLVNSDLPWLSASLDRAINPGDINLLDGSELEKSAPLELKTLDVYLAKQFESGIPPIYIAQLMTQMMITESNYGELFILTSDKEFHLYPMEYRRLYGEAIQDSTKIFYDLVNKAKEYKGLYDLAMLDRKTSQANEIEAEVYKILPMPSQGQEEVYKLFLNEAYTRSEIDTRIMGSESELKVAKDLIYLQDLEKEVNALLEGKKNIIKSVMKANEVIGFPDTNFALTWKSNVNGSRVFRASKPEKISAREDLIDFCNKKDINIQDTY